MKKIFNKHQNFWNEYKIKSLILGLILITIATVIQIGLGKISTQRALSSQPAKDLFLDNLPIINTQIIIIQGALIFWILSWIYIVLNPKYLIFSLKASALFIIIRSFFINLTPLGIYPHYIPFEEKFLGFNFYNFLTFEGNFFFSGHVGYPVLLSLIFWNNKKLRKTYIILAIIFGISVLLAHSHYSIDVFASPFITYTIFNIAKKLFNNDYKIINSN
ncbi:MAG: phosphatase PAP2-related protein [bacterium]|nr:sphingomyelin synthase family protein [Patescibacteria group bacterium]MDW8279825.1 phosphatase PAP2-related protein [bacterium]